MFLESGRISSKGLLLHTILICAKKHILHKHIYVYKSDLLHFITQTVDCFNVMAHIQKVSI